MRELLEALAAGEIGVAEAEARLSGYATGEAGRFDAARVERSGVPEAILGEDKTPAEIADLAATSLATTGRAIATRLDPPAVAAIRAVLADEAPRATVEWSERGRWLVARRPDFDPPDLDASVGVVTAGTSDAEPAGEAAMVAREMGATVNRVSDVGVASLARVVDRLPALRERDVLVVAAGREGALPTVVAGLVEVPVIALPVSTGYGHGGAGQAALAGMLQSCTALTVVNVDAGFTAGAQAGLIARRIDAARNGRMTGEPPPGTGEAGHSTPDGEYVVYVLRCADDTLYTGYTTDVERRLAEHDAGEGAKYTRGRTPVELVHVETFADRSAAMAREHAIKARSRPEKLALVGDGRDSSGRR